MSRAYTHSQAGSLTTRLPAFIIISIFTRMNLIPNHLINLIPELYDTEDNGDPTVWVKLFFPDFHWTWYITEYDGEDLCYGLVAGPEAELGYFRLSELQAARGKFGCCIERDRSFTPRPLSEVVSMYA